ncbi:MAG: ABC transporter permease [Clostridia bacterium]|nr:ABC transporter permease [Clostridia bacterium]
MTNIEKEEINRLPAKYRPLGAWAYFGYQLLFSIPLVGLICIIVFACSGDNINRRSYARSFFCVYIIVGIVLIIVLVVGGGCLAAMFARK